MALWHTCLLLARQHEVTSTISLLSLSSCMARIAGAGACVEDAGLERTYIVCDLLEAVDSDGLQERDC